MNPANAITVARVLLVPVFVWAAYSDREGSAVAALVIFVTAALSDLVDGYLARRHDMITRLGQFLDPTADKLLVGAALVVLVDIKDFPLWAAVVVAVREAAVQVLRTRIVSRGQDLPASSAGKLKTVLQAVMVSLWLLSPQETFVHWILLAAALSVTVFSAWAYFRAAVLARAALRAT